MTKYYKKLKKPILGPFWTLGQFLHKSGQTKKNFPGKKGSFNSKYIYTSTIPGKNAQLTDDFMGISIGHGSKKQH